MEKLEWNEAKIKIATINGTAQFSFNTEGADELIEVFKTIMYWMSYMPETIDEIFKGE